MYYKKIKIYTLAILCILGLCLAITPAVSWSFGNGKSKWFKYMIPSEDEIFGWIEDMWEIGDQGRYGYRMPGTLADVECAEYVLEKFEEFGLEDTILEPVPATVCYPDEWSLTITVDGVDEELPCYFLRYADFTSLEGITAEMVYVGMGTEDNFNAVDVTGKIVVVDVIAPGIPNSAFDPISLFTYDPDDTLTGDMAIENWPPLNLDSSYHEASERGAAGYVGILTFTVANNNQFLHWYADGSLPGLTVSPSDGAYLRNLLLTDEVDTATMVLTGVLEDGLTYNVYGSLQGKTDEIIVVQSHHDGWASNEASGMSVVMALAKYFAKIPKCFREKSLLFVGFGSHFGKKASWDNYPCLLYDSLPKVACAIVIEMIGAQLKIIDGEYVSTGLISPTGFGINRELLVPIIADSIVENGLDRSTIIPIFHGEGNKYNTFGVPAIERIAENAPQFTKDDTPDTVAKEKLVPTTKAFIDIINKVDEIAAPMLRWVKTIDDRGVKGYPDLREYIWEMTRAPYGPFDRIGLHRLVKEGIEPEGVIFLLPGTWSNGEQLTSNPPDDWWTADEDHSFAFYLANRNFDVYAIDYRTHFVNQYLEPPDLSFMAEWGWDEWISDIKEAVELAKAVSGVERVYIAGDSFGGSAAMNYASMYWKEDLKGILLRDGGTGAKYPELVDNSYNLPAMIAGMIATGAWAREVGSAPGSIFILQYADQNPTAPAINPYTGDPLEPVINPFTGLPWANIQEWAAFAIYMAWGPGVVSNIYGGYGDPAVMIHIDATFDRYWPSRLSLESAAISDWDNCPYVSFDFDDHYCEIDVPILAFTSELMGLAYWGPFRHGIANPDFTGIYLWGYGHLDVYSGEYSAVEVSQPTVEWLMSHRMLIGSGLIWCGGSWITGEAAIYINAMEIEIRINNIRISWDIYTHYLYKTDEYYKGKNWFDRIMVVITGKGKVFTSGRKVFFMGRKV